MPSIETSIWLALKARVQSLVLTPALPIAWPNEAFIKPGPKIGYLRVSWIPNTNRRTFIGSEAPHQRIGIVQVDVFGKRSENAAVTIEIAGKVAAHFPADLRLGADGLVRITKIPDVGQPMPDDTHIQVPVTVEYEAWA